LAHVAEGGNFDVRQPRSEPEFMSVGVFTPLPPFFLPFFPLNSRYVIWDKLQPQTHLYVFRAAALSRGYNCGSVSVEQSLKVLQVSLFLNIYDYVLCVILSKE